MPNLEDFDNDFAAFNQALVDEFRANAGQNVVVIASKGGAPTSPDWFHNLVAHPDVTVELANETFEARARVAVEPERERLYRAQAALMPNFAEYEKATAREIPVVVLERV